MTKPGRFFASPATQQRRGWLPGALLVALVSTGCGATRPAEPVEPPTGEVAPAPSRTSPGSTRRVFEGCDPAEAARRHEGLVGERVRIQWAWQDETAASAQLRVPAVVLRVDPPRVVVTFEAGIRNLPFFTSVWLYSGHIEALPDGSFGVAPCSATIERNAG